MSEKKPQAGEWWQDLRDNQIVQVVIVTSINDVCVREKGGRLGVWQVAQFAVNYEHLPDCTGFDWQPETFPQWYSHNLSRKNDGNVAYIKRLSKSDYSCVTFNGKHEIYPWTETLDEWIKSGKWTQITQAEAESRVKKPEPVESPDDWVTQDRVPDRPGIDEWRWSYHDGTNSRWCKSRDGNGRFDMHGTIEEGDTFEVRCRRRDLPPMPQETPKRDPKDREVKHDGTGFYLEDGK